ncbi:MAG TPA: DUF4339 domain-containing protein, partial [Tepidisphaeraceae bacterium]|nr:DUF4339 domain-containing protein [Tepidisphaeraceae bacterium]
MSSELDPQPQWYYARDGQRAGPVGQAVLCQWLTSGQVPAATLVWHEANQAWVEARAVPAFRAAIEERPASSVPPPPPPPPQPSVVESANGSGESPTAPKPSWHRRKSVRWAVPLAACAAIAAGVAVKSQILPQWASAALPAAAPAALPVVAASAPAPAPAKPAKPNEPPTLRIKISAVPTQLPAPKPMATPAGGQPSAAAKPLVPLPSLDDLSRRRAAIGRWVAMGKPVGPQHHRARTTLALLADGRFDQ